MSRFMLVALTLVLAALVSGVQADDKNSPTGTWKWTPAAGGGGKGTPREMSLKLKLDGDKLTGSIPGRNNAETNIEEGTFKNGEVTFKITRERNGNKPVTSIKSNANG